MRFLPGVLPRVLPGVLWDSFQESLQESYEIPSRSPSKSPTRSPMRFLPGVLPRWKYIELRDDNIILYFHYNEHLWVQYTYWSYPYFRWKVSRVLPGVLWDSFQESLQESYEIPSRSPSKSPTRSPMRFLPGVLQRVLPAAKSVP
jgi:hypothetical protein